MQWAFMWLAAAHGGDLTDLVPAWTVTEEAIGPGHAAAVFFEPTGEVTAAGWVDPGGVEDRNAWVSTYAATGELTWSRVDDAGPYEGTADGQLSSSDDRWYDAMRDDEGRLVLCGQRGTIAPYEVDWLVTTLLPDESVEWEVAFHNSARQGCRGIAAGATTLYTAGFNLAGGATSLGQWHLWAVQRNTGLIVQPLQVSYGYVVDNPNEAVDVARYDDESTVAVGVATQTETPYDPAVVAARVERRSAGVVEWAHEVEGARFDAVAVHEVSGRTAVVGEQDGQGLILGFNQSSGAVDQPPLWSVSWSEAGDSGITGVAVDEEGAFVALGWVEDGGAERWQLVRYDNGDGTELDRLELAAWSGASRPYAAAFDDGLLAVAGVIADPTEHFGVVLLGPDRDGDQVADVGDGCPDDAGKTEPGVCGCGVGDTDTDGDGVIGCEEDCPSDPLKTEPGECGCNVADEDSDGDGVLDCNDECDSDPDKVDAGVCGCFIPDSDDDGDGYLVCQDQCPDSAPGAIVDVVGCEIVETVDTAAEDTGSAPIKLDEGCGCRTAGVSPWWGLLLVAGWMRRRSAAAPGC